MQSLAVDKAKEEIKKQKLSEEREKAEWQLGIHQMRSARVEAEPKIEVSMRHMHYGIVSRSFHPHKIMSHVYDWVGS